MSPRFANEDIDQVRERADIVEVVSEHVRLRRAGRSYKGLCPFHQEKTPSFNVNPDKQVYFCHGCGASGSVFTFVQEVDGLSFPEAVEMLAHRCGVELREVSSSKQAPSPRARLLALHEAAVDHYRELLASRQGSRVREYLTDRGIGPEAWDHYRIGYGGTARNGVVQAMVRAGFTAEELAAGGLAIKDGRGVRDMFTGRVLFPIFDPSHRPVGFGGRVLPDRYRPAGLPDGPKYLNSRETAIFKKSKILYGANWARPEVVRSKRLVLVEGYTDVIALHGAGVGEAVATCGTALTEDHMKEISTRFGDVRVILCLDADAAGQAAMSRERTEELAGAFAPGEHVRGGWLPVGRGWLPEVHVADLPLGLDPADFAAQEGSEGLERILGASVPLVQFMLRRAVVGDDLSSPEGRTRAVRRAAGVLGQVGDPLLRHEYALWLAGRVGVDAAEVLRTVGSRIAKPSSVRRGEGPQRTVAVTGHHRVEREALRVLANVADVDADVFPSEEDFTLPVHRAVFRLLVQDRSDRGSVDIGRIATAVQDDELRRALSELSTGEAPEARVIRETLVRLKELALKRHIEEMKARLKTLDAQRDADAYDTMFEELLGLEKQRRGLGA